MGLTKQAVKRTLGQAFFTLLKFEIIIVEIEVTLNDRPLTYILSEITDPEGFTPACLIYARRILAFPHTLDDLGELVDPTSILSDQDMKKHIDTHSQLT